MKRNLCQVFCLVLTIFFLTSMIVHTAQPGDPLPAPWGKIKEYALSGDIDKGTYIKIIRNNNNGIAYGFTYDPRDGSIGLHRFARQDGYAILVRVLELAKVRYRIIDGKLATVLAEVPEADACAIAYQCFRELVQGKLI